MKIIGINAYHADASAALLVNGKLVAAIEEERFTRKKHWAGFPAKSIEFCLKEGGLSFDQIDYFAIGRDPKAKFLNKLWYLSKNPFGSGKTIWNRLQNSRQVGSIEKELSQISGLSTEDFLHKIKHVEHHRSHLASAYFASPFSEAACLSIDGSGDFTTTMTGVATDNTIKVLDSLDFPHSLGIFYTAFTQLLGFPHYGDEYKVMGMAPYGKPVYLKQLEKVIRLTSDGLFKLNLKYFRKGTDGFVIYDDDHNPRVYSLYNDALQAEFGEIRKEGEPLTTYHKDLAASVQAMTEQVIFHILNDLHAKTGMDKLCIAGGVAQNSVVNGKIKLNTPFREVYIPSAGHDAGISMGAAMYVRFQGKPEFHRAPIFTAGLGSKFSNSDIISYLRSRKLDFLEYADHELFEMVSKRLIEGDVVGWFAGRAEFGPRALGSRSILADPRRSDARDLLNAKIKRRESFRPFAPSILKEYVDEYFEQSDDVPFMEKVFKFKSDKKGEVPAVVHVDGTGRLQTVDKVISPRYYQLIDAFRELTGVPILLNTSFNENEPIVNAPAEAVDCFLRTDMDMLVMENIVLRKPIRS